VSAAAVAERPAAPANPYRQPAGQGLGFYTGEDGYIYCDNLKVDDIRQQVHDLVADVAVAGMRVYMWGSVWEAVRVVTQEYEHVTVRV
jgi:hypothetical protein